MQYGAFSVASFLQLCILLDANASVSKHSDLKLLEGLSLTRNQFSALIVVKSALCCNTCLEEYRLQASILSFVLYCKAKKKLTCKLFYSCPLWQCEISFQKLCSPIMAFLKYIICFNRKVNCGFTDQLAVLLFVICKGAAEDTKDEGSSLWQVYYGLIFHKVQNPRKFIYFQLFIRKRDTSKW